MEKVLSNVTTNQEEKYSNRTRKCLLYEDDVVVLGHVVKHKAEDMTAAASITDWLEHKCIKKQKYY
jgi:hypothetical protein